MRRDRYEEEDSPWPLICFWILVLTSILAFMWLLASDIWSAYSSMHATATDHAVTVPDTGYALLERVAASAPLIMLVAVLYVISCVVATTVKFRAVALLGWLAAATIVGVHFHGNHQDLLSAWLLSALGAVSAFSTTCSPILPRRLFAGWAKPVATLG